MRSVCFNFLKKDTTWKFTPFRNKSLQPRHFELIKLCYIREQYWQVQAALQILIAYIF